LQERQTNYPINENVAFNGVYEPCKTRIAPQVNAPQINPDET